VHGAGARFTARLAVTAGDRAVRASLRMVAFDPLWPYIPPDVRVVTSDGASSRTGLPPIDALPSCPAGARCYADATTLEIPLPSHGEGEVMIDVARFPSCGPALPPAPGFLLDDLRVE
jgi:hypothetical protein